LILRLALTAKTGSNDGEQRHYNQRER